MINVLIVRTSSMGDLIHTWPAITELVCHYPNLVISWMAEENVADLARLHPAVSHVILFCWRRWRKRLFNTVTWRELQNFYACLRATHWDLVLDSQGLLKSAIPAWMTRAPLAGYSWSSSREPVASLLYDHKVVVSRKLSAIDRNRQLYGKVFGYTPEGPPIFGISSGKKPSWLPKHRYVVLLHATSQAPKEWPETHWIELACHLWYQNHVRVILPWGNTTEQQRAMRMAVAIPEAIVAPKLILNEAAAMLEQAIAVVGVDTGLTHLANALKVPLVAIYTATDPSRTGVVETPYAINLGNIGQCPTVKNVLDELAKRWAIAL